MNPEQQLSRILDEQGKVPKDTQKFRNWFLCQFKNNANNCNLEEFAIYYLQTLRQCTEQHFRGNEPETPKNQTPVRLPPNVALQSTPNNSSYTPRRLLLHNSTPQPMSHIPHMEFSNHKNESLSLAEGSVDKNSQLNSSMTRSFTQSVHSNASTPGRLTPNQHQQGRRSCQTATATCTPQSAERSNRQSSGGGSGLCLGDFLVANTPTHNRSRKKSTPQYGGQEANVSNVGGSGSKPKKRVVPTTISTNVTSAITFGSATSSFSNENNLLRLNDNGEIIDPSQCSILEARKSLKLNANEISKELVEQQPFQMETMHDEIADYAPAAVDLAQVTQSVTLDLLADIYAQLMDLNLVPNILTELAYVLQLLNIPESNLQTSIQAALTNEPSCVSNSQISLLLDFTNCIYFALRVLHRQCQLLLQLDLKSLGVVLNNERIGLLPKELQMKLERAYQSKQKLLQNAQQPMASIMRLDSSFKNVYYQHDKDSRQHFPTTYEFAAFKTQRDLFYKSLKQWELNHLNPNFNFATEMTPRIREIFRQSENAVNMAHFAKLFVAQLLISASDVSTSPQELGVEMDMQKFSKLTQRLVAPSNSSVDYQFPRSQAYFRDFIKDAGSIAFLVQLKLALYAQLITFNDSSFEQVQLFNTNKTLEEDETEQQPQNTPFIVRPEVLASMLVLAKFLGYVTALPYKMDDNAVPLTASQLQVQLRAHFKPDFDVSALLQQATSSGKLLITLPWLVQYLAMLDIVTLQLACYLDTLQLLFELYLRIEADDKLRLLPMATFIVRCCIGWLLEVKPHITEQYYNYHAACTAQDNKAMSQLVATSLNSLKMSDTKLQMQLNPMLEQLVQVACPFLPEFRVSIMPAKYAMTKCASRTGRYRHITTRYAVLTPPSSSQSPTTKCGNPASSSTTGEISENELLQNKLIEAFLHSQHASMRRLIEFVTERTYKSVVKDAQNEILLPSKVAADNKVNALTSNKYSTVLNAVRNIYVTAREEASAAWYAQTPGMIDTRITQSLDTLLPKATNEVIKRTYHQLIKRNTAQQVQHWLNLNFLQSQFYCNDLQDMAKKICKANKTTPQVTSSTELRIVPNALCVSDLLDDLKYWLHCTSQRPDLISNSYDLENFMRRIRGAFVHTLPTVFYRLVGGGIVQLFQHLISRHTHLLTPTMIDTACMIWLMPELHEQTNRIPGDMPVPGIFEALITVGFIETLGVRHERFEKLHELLVAMIRAGVINLDTVNVLFMPLFKETWAPVVWNELSQLLANVAAETGNLTTTKETGNHIDANCDDAEDAAKSQLFMEVLADLSRDIDF